MGNSGYYGNQQTKGQKIRFAIVTLLVALVVLGIGVWAIVYLVSGRNRRNNNVNNSNVAVESQVSGGSNRPATTPSLDNGTESDDNSAADGSNTAGQNGGTDSANGTIGDGTSVAGTANNTNGANNANGTVNGANANPATSNGNIPSTGPADFLPLALLAGVLVAYVCSKELVPIND